MNIRGCGDCDLPGFLREEQLFADTIGAQHCTWAVLTTALSRKSLGDGPPCHRRPLSKITQAMVVRDYLWLFVTM